MHRATSCTRRADTPLQLRGPLVPMFGNGFRPEIRDTPHSIGERWDALSN
jgi:hypothetical protein